MPHAGAKDVAFVAFEMMQGGVGRWGNPLRVAVLDWVRI
jgi:hypothetical protein